MQESSASPPPTFFLPLWARIAFACFMFFGSALSMCKGFFRFEWVGLLCLGLFYLVNVPMRQKGEARKAYFRQPRTIISLALLIAAVVAALFNLHFLFTK